MRKKKLEWWSYEKVEKSEDMLTRCDRILERDGRTPRHGIGRTMHNVARQRLPAEPHILPTIEASHILVSLNMICETVITLPCALHPRRDDRDDHDTVYFRSLFVLVTVLLISPN